MDTKHKILDEALTLFSEQGYANVYVNDIAKDAVEKLSKDENAKKVANQAINEVEKKAKVDLPDVDGLKKMIK